MKKFFTENKKTLLILAGLGATAAAAAGLVYALTQNKKAAVAITPEAGAQKKGLTKLERANIMAQIKVEYDANRKLTVKTIELISDAVYKLTIPEFLELTQKDREERRTNLDNIEVYVKLWEQYTLKLDELFVKNQQAILQELNISENAFEESSSHHISEGNQDLFMLQTNLVQRLRSSLKPTKTLTLEEFKTIFRAQLEILNAEIAALANLQDTIRPEDSAPLVNNRVSDLIFHKFQVEEEDLTAAYTKYELDPEVETLKNEIQTATLKLFPDLADLL